MTEESPKEVQTMTGAISLDDAWKVFQQKLAEGATGALEINQCMDELEISEEEKRKRFVAFAVEVKSMLHFPVFRNRPQLLSLGKRWGVTEEQIKTLVGV
jgi:hypothetical protein